jgi:hypothetical protein
MPETGRQAKDPGCQELDDVIIAAADARNRTTGQGARSWMMEAKLRQMPRTRRLGQYPDARSRMIKALLLHMPETRQQAKDLEVPGAG